MSRAVERTALFTALGVACIAAAQAWSRSASLATALAETERLRDELRIVKAAVGTVPELLRPSPFLVGSVLEDGIRAPIKWNSPVDGLYLIVSPDCVWCEPILKDLAGAVSAGETNVVLVTDDPERVETMVGASSNSRQHLIITPGGGWWNAGLPQAVTPMWLRYADGHLEGFGLGAPRDAKGDLRYEQGWE